MNNYIVTIGTSLYYAYKGKNNEEPTKKKLVEFLSINDPKRISAEINTIERIKNLDFKKSYFYLIASDTNDGKMCAQAIEEYLENVKKSNSEIKIIKGLNREAKAFEEIGLINFINEVSAIINNTDRNVSILATGGYKAEIAYANVIGQLYGIKIYYIHDDFKSLIIMPSVLIGYDMTMFDLYYNNIMDVIETPDPNNKIFYKNLPYELKGLIKRDKQLKRYVLSPIGTAYLNYYRSDFWKRDKKTFRVYSEPPHHTLWGENVDSLNDIRNSSIVKILERIFNIGKTIIVEMKLKEMKKGKTNVEPHLKFDKLVRNNIVSYWIVTNQGQQRLHIKTKPNMNEVLLELIGKKIYE